MTYVRQARRRTGNVLIAMVVLLILLNLIVVEMVVGVSREHDATVRRANTVESFYAAEAGMNMAIREVIEESDEDGDGTVGSISNDGDDANDPRLGRAQFVVVKSPPNTPYLGQWTVTSQGRSGQARREMSSVME